MPIKNLKVIKRATTTVTAAERRFRRAAGREIGILGEYFRCCRSARNQNQNQHENHLPTDADIRSGYAQALQMRLG